MDRKPESDKNQAVFLEKHPYAFLPKPTHAEQSIKRLEAEIDDIRRCMRGDTTSKAWKLFEMKLINLNQERRVLIFATQREVYRDKVKMDATGTFVVNWQDAIPFL